MAKKKDKVYYPRWLYHKKHGGRIFENEEDVKAVGPDWRAKPYFDSRGKPVVEYHKSMGIKVKQEAGK